MPRVSQLGWPGMDRETFNIRSLGLAGIFALNRAPRPFVSTFYPPSPPFRSLAPPTVRPTRTTHVGAILTKLFESKPKCIFDLLGMDLLNFCAGSAVAAW